MRILVVEDEQAIATFICQGLTESGYAVDMAVDGAEALHWIAIAEYDLVILDVMLPDMNGYAVCKSLKNHEETHNIPVIFITVRNNYEEEAFGLDLGAVDFISKPFHNAVVKARVRTHIRLKQKSDMLEKMVAIDGLTDIPNRRAFEELRAREWSRGRRTEVNMSALMIDIDMF